MKKKYLWLTLLVGGCLGKMGTDTGRPDPDTDADTDADADADTDTDADADAHPPVVNLTAPSSPDYTFWADVPFDFAFDVSDAGSDLSNVDLLAISEGATKEISSLHEVDSSGGSYAIRAGLSNGVGQVQLLAQDQAGGKGRDQETVTVWDCRDFNPVARWTFDDDSDLKIEDASPWNTDGTPVGGDGGPRAVSRVTGIFGMAVDLSSQKTYIKGTIPEDASSGSGASMVGYFLYAPHISEEPVFLLSGDRGRLSLDLWTDSVGVSIGPVDARSSMGTQEILCDGDWHQLALVLDSGGTVTVYIDASQVYTAPVALGDSLDWSSNPFQLGGDADGTAFSSAIVDDFTLLDGTLGPGDLEKMKQANTAFCYGE